MTVAGDDGIAQTSQLSKRWDAIQPRNQLVRRQAAVDLVDGVGTHVHGTALFHQAKAGIEIRLTQYGKSRVEALGLARGVLEQLAPVELADAAHTPLTEATLTVVDDHGLRHAMNITIPSPDDM